MKLPVTSYVIIGFDFLIKMGNLYDHQHIARIGFGSKNGIDS